MQHRQMLSQTSLDHAVRSCAFSPDASHIAAGMKNGSFMVLRTRYIMKYFQLHLCQNTLERFNFSPGGKVKKLYQSFHILKYSE